MVDAACIGESLSPSPGACTHRGLSALTTSIQVLTNSVTALTNSVIVLTCSIIVLNNSGIVLTCTHRGVLAKSMPTSFSLTRRARNLLSLASLWKLFSGEERTTSMLRKTAPRILALPIK